MRLNPNKTNQDAATDNQPSVEAAATEHDEEWTPLGCSIDRPAKYSVNRAGRSDRSLAGAYIHR